MIHYTSSVDSLDIKQKWFHERKELYSIRQEEFSNISGMPIAYWISHNMLNAFVEFQPLGKISEPRQGLITGDNERFLREWYEIYNEKINKKWFVYNKGGEYRKWYGNNDLVVNWENSGREIISLINKDTGKQKSRPQNVKYYFREGFTWTTLSIGSFSARYMPQGQIFDAKGSSCFAQSSQDVKSIMGLTNSCVSAEFFKILSPTVDYSAGSIAKLPIAPEILTKSLIVNIIDYCIDISRQDWDSFETSWDFQQHPLIRCASISRQEIDSDAKKHIQNIHYLEDAFINWSNECDLRFAQLKSNEEELNRIFIDIYGLQNELTPEVEDKDVTVRKADLQRDIKSLISYAVGCMFGRYSLDKEGLIFAGGCMKDKFAYYGGTYGDASQYKYNGKYTYKQLGSKFYYLPIEGKKALECWKVDADNIIPIMDDEYFEDDIVEKFVTFIRTVYGEQSLNANLQFIADALGGKGQPKEVIRNYFINDFYKDHCKIYQKRPIYWLFDSGKKNGFKCLIYMHRYQPDTIARIRTDYVHEQQSRYRTAIADLEHRSANAGTSERVKLNKSLKKLQEQADELHAYEEKIHHLADQMIAIDLDDGVKHNYEIFQDVLAKIK